MRKWTNQEIMQAKNMRQEKKSFKTIGRIFNVTANAVRKAIIRHSKEFITTEVMVNPQYIFTKQNIINYGLQAGIIHIPPRNKIECIQQIMMINKHRIQNNLPILSVSTEHIITSYDNIL